MTLNNLFNEEERVFELISIFEQSIDSINKELHNKILLKGEKPLS